MTTIEKIGRCIRQLLEPQPDSIYIGKSGRWMNVFVILMVIAFLASLVWIFLAKTTDNLQVLGSIWTITPPAWFSFEFFYLYRRFGQKGKDYWDRFQYGQDISAKVWAAMLAVLLARAVALSESPWFNLSIGRMHLPAISDPAKKAQDSSQTNAPPTKPHTSS